MIETIITIFAFLFFTPIVFALGFALLFVVIEEMIPIIDFIKHGKHKNL